MWPSRVLLDGLIRMTTSSGCSACSPRAVAGMLDKPRELADRYPKPLAATSPYSEQMLRVFDQTAQLPCGDYAKQVLILSGTSPVRADMTWWRLCVRPFPSQPAQELVWLCRKQLNPNGAFFKNQKKVTRRNRLPSPCIGIRDQIIPALSMKFYSRMSMVPTSASAQ